MTSKDGLAIQIRDLRKPAWAVGYDGEAALHGAVVILATSPVMETSSV